MAGNQIITVKEADGVTLTDVEVLGTGRQAAAASKSLAWSTEDQAAIGIVTETAPAGDTASSGLNGRLQRIAQRLSSLIGLFPNALGASGGLKVEIVAGAGSGGTATADKGAFVAGTTSGTPAMGFYQTTVTANPLTTGQAGWVQMTPFRANHINLRDSAGNELVLPAALGGSGGLKVEVIGGASGGTSSTVGSAVPSTATAVGGSDGTNMRIPRVFDEDSGAGTDYVLGAAIRAPASGGSTDISYGSGATSAATIRVTLASDSAGITTTGSQASPSTSYLSSVVAGDVASAASDSGNPVKIGGVGKTTNPTAVTDGQRVNALFDKLGKQVVVGAVRDLKGIQQTSVSNTTAETTVVTAVASTFLDVYGIILANTGASTTRVTIKDATAGTTRAIIEVPTLETRGFTLPVDSAIPQAAVNNNWTVTCGTATTALEVTVFYVRNT